MYRRSEYKTSLLKQKTNSAVDGKNFGRPKMLATKLYHIRFWEAPDLGHDKLTHINASRGMNKYQVCATTLIWNSSDVREMRLDLQGICTDCIFRHQNTTA